MIKDQFFRFYRVILSFGHIFWGLNLMFLSEILQNVMGKIEEFTPAKFQQDLWVELGYYPGSPLEILFRIFGLTLVVLGVILAWRMSKNQKEPAIWMKPLAFILLIDLAIYITVLWQGIKINVLHNAPMLIVMVIATFLWIHLSKSKSVESNDEE